MIKCPNCGSTAQVRMMCGGQYKCGCGQIFRIDNKGNCVKIEKRG